jgi:hypothetical protein
MLRKAKKKFLDFLPPADEKKKFEQTPNFPKTDSGSFNKSFKIAKIRKTVSGRQHFDICLSQICEKNLRRLGKFDSLRY